MGAAIVGMALLEIAVLGGIAFGISKLVGLHDTGLVIYWLAMSVLIFWFVIGKKIRKIRRGGTVDDCLHDLASRRAR